MGTIRVLHVDDDPGFCDLVADCLEREDAAFEVYTETSADAALDHLFDDGVDCVVSDYDMPETDGLEFLELVSEHDETLPFILFPGKGSESVASEAFSAGATDYLRKETGTDQFTVLANRVRNYVEERRSESRRRTELAAFEAAQEGIGLLDGDDRFTYVNEAYADLYGYDPAEMVGAHWELVYPPRKSSSYARWPSRPPNPTGAGTVEPPDCGPTVPRSSRTTSSPGPTVGTWSVRSVMRRRRPSTRRSSSATRRSSSRSATRSTRSTTGAGSSTSTTRFSTSWATTARRSSGRRRT